MRDTVADPAVLLKHIFDKLAVMISTEGCCTCIVQGGSNMTGTDLYVNKPHCAAAVRP